jgi:hypothetical protein
VTLTIWSGSASASISRTINVGSGGVGEVYWVSPTGTAAWAGAKSQTPLSGTACCSLATANSNAIAGDTIYLRGGTYSVDKVRISPSNSGSLASRITYVAYTGETPTFIRTSSNNPAISITGKDYIVVDGITASNLATWIRIGNGADYNEIKNCTFNGTTNYDHAVRIYDGGGGTASTNNWLHQNSFSRCGYVSGSSACLSMIKIDDAPGYTNGVSHYNTIENNTISYSGHDSLSTYTKYNVIKNNFWHNEGWMSGSGSYTPDNNGLYGDRNNEIYDGRSNAGLFYLIEGNRKPMGGTD